MQFSELLAVISTHAIRLQREDGDLIVLGDDEALEEGVWDQLVAHKQVGHHADRRDVERLGDEAVKSEH